MNFRQILEILKGDVVGHEFHGNQWINGSGKFNAGGGKPRPAAKPKPAGQRRAAAPKPAPAPRRVAAPKPPAPTPPRPETPKPTPPPVKLPEPQQSLKPAVKDWNEPGPKVLATNEIASYDKKLGSKGGAQNTGLQLVTMKDGSAGVVKGLAEWGKNSPKQLAKAEVAAGKIGAAMGISIAKAEPVPGEPKKIVMPLIKGETAFDSRGADNVSSECNQQRNEMYFFDKLIGNGDRHFGNFMYTNLTPRNWVTQDSQVVAIDHSLCLGNARYEPFPPQSSDLVQFAVLKHINSDRLTQMYTGLKDLQAAKNNTTFEKDAVDKCVGVMEKAFPFVTGNDPTAKKMYDRMV